MPHELVCPEAIQIQLRGNGPNQTKISMYAERSDQHEVSLAASAQCSQPKQKGIPVSKRPTLANQIPNTSLQLTETLRKECGCTVVPLPGRDTGPILNATPINMHQRLLIWFCIVVIGGARLEAYTGRVPAHAVSNRFDVLLKTPTDKSNGSLQVSPMVYQSFSPDDALDKIHPPSFCALHGGHFCNRSMSWVEFGQEANETVTIAIQRLDGLPFPNNTRVLPMSYNLSVSVSGSEATITVRGNCKHFILDHGQRPSSDEDSSFAHLMMVFIGGLDPDPAEYPNALVFGPGVHRFDGDGILQLPKLAQHIILLRGAWVEGRVNISQGIVTSSIF
jgi:hypothetical protein